MAEKTRTCPECGGTMAVRLGEFQCQQCGQTLPLTQPEEPAARGGYGSPSYGSGAGLQTRGEAGLKTRPTNDPGAQYRSAPAPPPAAPPAYAASGAAGMYSPDARSSGGSLEVEKKVFLGLQVLWILVQVVGGFMADPMTGVLTLVIGAVILGLYYWVFMGEELWAKWACTGCLGLGAISTLVTMFSGAGYMKLLPQLQGVSESAINSFLLVVGIIQLLWTGWIISILWRDIQSRTA
jgi:hypothetical protein